MIRKTFLRVASCLRIGGRMYWTVIHPCHTTSVKALESPSTRTRYRFADWRRARDGKTALAMQCVIDAMLNTESLSACIANVEMPPRDC